MEILEDKYIELLFHCILLKKDDILFLEYNSSNEKFANKVKNKATALGVKEIILYIENDYEDKKLISEYSIEEIKNHPSADTSIYDKSAEKGAKFLRIISPKPGFYNGVDENKVVTLLSTRKKTRPLYYKKLHNKSLVWNISTYPNQEWADFLFPNDPDSYLKLFHLIIKACGVDKNNPIQFWNDIIQKQKYYIDILNKLNISSLHYKNSLGTDLEVYLTDNTVWTSIADWDGIIVNLPSYEIFSNLDFRKTNGIVYSSKPLVYNNIVINNFWLKLENGKIIDYDAEEGKNALKTIIETDEFSRYLGEIAIVPKDSPVSLLNQILYETTLDENSSCHFSIGSGEIECVENSENLALEELIQKGVNTSSNHVDFMIGTDDLEIVATSQKEKVLIFSNGKWNI